METLSTDWDAELLLLTKLKIIFVHLDEGKIKYKYYVNFINNVKYNVNLQYLHFA